MSLGLPMSIPRDTVIRNTVIDRKRLLGMMWLLLIIGRAGCDSAVMLRLRAAKRA